MRQRRRGGCDTQPPLQRAWLSGGGTRFAKEHTIADRAAAKQCLVTLMCGNAPWSVRAPLSGSPRRSAASPPCADEGHQLRGRRPSAHQLQRRGPAVGYSPTRPTGVVPTATAVPVHSKQCVDFATPSNGAPLSSMASPPSLSSRSAKRSVPAMERPVGGPAQSAMVCRPA
jgi:hypothetical protein